MILALVLIFNFSFALGADAIKEEALKLWPKRDNQQTLEEALSKFQKAHEANPQDLEVLTYLARGYYFLAELHLSNEEQKMRNFEKARAFGEKGLLLNPEFKKQTDKKEVEKGIRAITEKEAPVLFWTAASIGKWARLNGIMSSLQYKGRIVAMIEQVEKVKPDFFYGAVPRYWGGFYALAPSIAGGDLKKSKKYFQRAMEMAPEYLGTKTLYAETYLVEKEDKKEFKKVLEEVLKAPNGPEAITPENMLEKKKAERLLENMDELF